MNFRRLLLGMLTATVLSGILTLPATAGTVSFDINGTLGPVLDGIDPLKFAGETFTATGSLDESTPPSVVTSGSATYDIPGSILISVGSLTLNGYNAALTIGSDMMYLDFSVVELSFTPMINATLALPPGTLSGTALQNFSASVSQPDSSFTFVIPDGSTVISGTLGITGTASMSGATTPPPPPGVPEPGTVGLLAGGLAAIVWKRSKG